MSDADDLVYAAKARFEACPTKTSFHPDPECGSLQQGGDVIELTREEATEEGLNRGWCCSDARALVGRGNAD